MDDGNEAIAKSVRDELESKHPNDRAAAGKLLLAAALKFPLVRSGADCSAERYSTCFDGLYGALNEIFAHYVSTVPGKELIDVVERSLVTNGRVDMFPYVITYLVDTSGVVTDDDVEEWWAENEGNEKSDSISHLLPRYTFAPNVQPADRTGG